MHKHQRLNCRHLWLNSKHKNQQLNGDSEEHQTLSCRAEAAFLNCSQLWSSTGCPLWVQLLVDYWLCVKESVCAKRDQIPFEEKGKNWTNNTFEHLFTQTPLKKKGKIEQTIPLSIFLWKNGSVQEKNRNNKTTEKWNNQPLCKECVKKERCKLLWRKRENKTFEHIPLKKKLEQCNNGTIEKWNNQFLRSRFERLF